VDIFRKLANSPMFPHPVEVKSLTGRVSPHQQQFIDEIVARGGVAFVASGSLLVSWSAGQD